MRTFLSSAAQNVTQTIKFNIIFLLQTCYGKESRGEESRDK